MNTTLATTLNFMYEVVREIREMEGKYYIDDEYKEGKQITPRAKQTSLKVLEKNLNVVINTD